MKLHRNVSPRQEQQAEKKRLYAAVAALRTAEECNAFFKDLCTPAELQAMADRWAVVEYVQKGLPYREIHRLTGVSVTTIGRVAPLRGHRQRRLSTRFPTHRRSTANAMATLTKRPEAEPPWMRTRLKLAVQKSGRLTDPSLDLLSRCGLEDLARQGPAHGLRREHAARRAVRARRRHSRSRAGRRVRPRPRRPERARGEASRARSPGHQGALQAAAHAGLTAAAACRSRSRTASRTKARLRCAAGASRRRIRSRSRTICASAT